MKSPGAFNTPGPFPPKSRNRAGPSLLPKYWRGHLHLTGVEALPEESTAQSSTSPLS
jgi:hypothetical protein